MGMKAGWPVRATTCHAGVSPAEYQYGQATRTTQNHAQYPARDVGGSERVGACTPTLVYQRTGVGAARGRAMGPPAPTRARAVDMPDGGRKTYTYQLIPTPAQAQAL